MPTPPAPKYGINDLVYLETSARVGFLEAYKVSNVVRSRGRWLYTISVGEKPPAETTLGGMVDLKRSEMLWFDEAELIDFHEALLLVKHSLELKLAKANALLHKYFPEGTATDA
jgi:hypothetical protein